jgi:hypothetical protein
VKTETDWATATVVGVRRALKAAQGQGLIDRGWKFSVRKRYASMLEVVHIRVTNIERDEVRSGDKWTGTAQRLVNAIDLAITMYEQQTVGSVTRRITVSLGDFGAPAPTLEEGGTPPAPKANRGERATTSRTLGPPSLAEHVEALQYCSVPYPPPGGLTTASLKAYYDAVHAEQVEVIGNILGMAERCLDRGHLDAARELLDEAQPHIRLRDHIESKWVPVST